MDGRDFETVRPIVCETGLLPGLMALGPVQPRGETQAVTLVTLGTSEDAQEL